MENTEENYYWVYVPEFNGEGTVVLAASFEAAAKAALADLEHEDDSDVQVHELGDSKCFTASDLKGGTTDA